MKKEVNKYKFRPYDPVYKKLFSLEKSKLVKILGKNVEIEHVGSTSIPGLGGKGIIDIAIMASKSNIKKFVRLLENLGFERSINHPGDDRRIFMQKIIRSRNKERRVHLHLCLTSEFWDSFISFRDYLKKHDKERDEYAKIKKEGAKLAKGDAKTYREHKADFLSQIARKAKEELK